MSSARSPAPRRAWCALVGATFVFSSGVATAQERVRFEELPDEALYAITVQRDSDGTASDPMRANGYAGVGGSIWRGAAGARIVAPFAGFGLGVWSSPSTFLQLRTEAILPVRDDLGAATSPSWRDVEGAHRLRAQLGVGALAEGETGADVEVEGSMLHAASTSTTFLRRDLPARAFWDGGARATLWPRFMEKRDEGIVAPLSYAVRRVEYDGANGVVAGGFTSERLASGFGLRDYDGRNVHGWIELVGVGWEHARFDATPGLPRPRLGGLERIDLKFLHLDAMMGAASSDVFFNVTTHVGGSWLWDATTRQEVSAFTFALAASVRQVPERGKPGDSMGAGVGVARRAGFLADGSALTQGWRVEAFADVIAFHGRAGGSLRAATEQLSLPLAATPSIDGGFRGVYATEWFLGLTPALHVGFFHVSTDRCPAVVAPTGDWCHQLGVFLRVRGETAPPPDPPASRSKQNDDSKILDDDDPLSATTPIVRH